MSIIFEEVGFTYDVHTPFETEVLRDVNFHIEAGKIYALVGHTGAGKSTVIQLFHGLLRPTIGTVFSEEIKICAANEIHMLKSLRKKIGMVFQFPESQLFEETVEKDLCFGPINFGFTEMEAKINAREALQQVGLPESFLNRSPFTLSGGEMRKVAIAGVLAFKPSILVLDEPTAGLDPESQQEILDFLYRLHCEEGVTIVLVSHQMDVVATYADEMIVMKNGTVVKQASPREIFSNQALLNETGLEVPTATKLQQQIEKTCHFQLDGLCLTAKELARALAEKRKGVLE